MNGVLNDSADSVEGIRGESTSEPTTHSPNAGHFGRIFLRESRSFNCPQVAE